MKKKKILKYAGIVLLTLTIVSTDFINARAQAGKSANHIDSLLDSFDVKWDTPGPTSAQSMPIGNGDIGLNVWVEKSGDLVFYISKTDAWGGELEQQKDPWMKQGGVLMKLGAIRVSVSPNPLAKDSSFKQILKLRNGEIWVQEGRGKDAVKLRVWVDANHPVIRIETQSGSPVSVNVKLSNWRAGLTDTVLENRKNQLAWYHHNSAATDPHLANLTFGAIVKGNGLVNKDATTLQSGKAARAQIISIYPLTAVSGTGSQWLSKLEQQVNENEKLNIEKARLAHQQWWQQFWQRSWIFLSGDDIANHVGQGYILQRFVTACAGRGAYPIKFNGSIFVVDNPAWKPSRNGASEKMDADFRAWGGQYWFQNTRAMYWPRLMAGDFDMMLPLFRMYANILPANEAQVKQYYGHGGAYFAETSPFWGGLLFMGPQVKANYTNHYFTPILELSMMMLDYYEYTGDAAFAKQTLLPVATAGLQFFDQHFSRDSTGKLLLDPDNAIEMFWKVHNPAPDIAGLHAVLSRMIKLPSDLVDEKTRFQWEKLYRELPPLPTTETGGKKLLLPYTGPQTAKFFNLENPELYAIYPFRLYGIGKPDLQLALHTFDVRKEREKGCWVQDPIQAAMVGETDVARDYVSFALTRKSPDLKFPAFWATAHDYNPDEDNGGNGENGLQQMLMQTDGKKIILLPAWPSDWDANFKLNAPYKTTVEGKVVKGKLTIIKVTPANRMADVIVHRPQ
jgi:alpha-L-fucosidase 2